MEHRYKNLFPTVKLIFSMAAFSTIMMLGVTIITGLLPEILVKAEGNFINSVISYKNNADINTIVRFFLILIIILLMDQMFSLVNKYLYIINREQIRKYIYNNLFSCIENTAFESLEEKDNQNLMMRVFDTPEIHFATLIKYIFLIMKYGVTIISLFLLLFSQIGIKALIIVVASLIIALISKNGGKQIYNLGVKNSDQKRNVEYYDNLLINKEFSDERTLFSYFRTINDKWNNKANGLIEEQASLSRAIFVQEKTASVALYIISFVIIAILLEPVINGVITIGFMVAFVNATFNLSNMVSRVLGNALSVIYKEIGYVNDYWKLQKISDDRKAHYGDQVLNSIETIQFRDVSFKYPGTETYVLKNCSFEMSKNNKFGLIGINGAGKSTIVKLLKGLYRDYEGTILINGIDIRNLSAESLSTEIAVVSQDFSKFQISFLENINLGRKNNVSDSSLILDTFKKLNFDKLAGNVNLNSKIGKVYPENIDLSLGEWQKLAISRAILSDASLLILDEPTASLDPIAEQQVYNQIYELSKNKMSILISHRLGAVKSSEDIFLLENGQVKIHGSHDGIMMNSNLYREMYSKQKGWYQNE